MEKRTTANDSPSASHTWAVVLAAAPRELLLAIAQRELDRQQAQGETRLTCPGCGRKLTNKVSAFYGIGLACARTIGDPKAEEIAAAIEAHMALQISTTKPAELGQLIDTLEEWVPLVGHSTMADARWAAAQRVALVHDLPLPTLAELQSLAELM